MPDQQAGHDASLGYHRVLLEDPHRLDAFERAIRTLVRPDDVVLDLGCGTGLFGMLAARRGAARVHAVESMPVALLAKALIEANGLHGVVTVHHADARFLDPVEPVDLVVSDCLGRFLVDDGMIPAVVKAGQWLKPTGRFCPSAIQLFLAPVGLMTLGAVDTFAASFYGLDYGAALPYAWNHTYKVDMGPEHLLATEQLFHDWAPPDAPAPFTGQVEFELTESCELRGVVGWFEATLAPGITLSNQPGHETHWGQILFPVPISKVTKGDRFAFELELTGDHSEPSWRWSGHVEQDGRQRTPRFDLESLQRIGQRSSPQSRDERYQPLTREQILATNQKGAKAFHEGRLVEAIDSYNRAIWALTPDCDDFAAGLFENLGLAYFNASQVKSAARAFLRALDGKPTSRKQSLRFLIDCLIHTGCQYDAGHYLGIYLDAFGEHPSGWKPGTLERR